MGDFYSPIKYVYVPWNINNQAYPYRHLSTPGGHKNSHPLPACYLFHEMSAKYMLDNSARRL